MITDNVLPSARQIMHMQDFLGHSTMPAIKAYRSHAKAIYEQLSSDIPKGYSPHMEVSWDMIYLNDFYVPTYELMHGIRFCDLRDAIHVYPDLVSKHMLIYNNKAFSQRKLIAFVEACFNRAAVLVIPPGVHVTMPLDLYSLLGAYRQDLLLEKLVIIVGAGACVTLHDTLRSTYLSAHTIMRSIDYYIGHDATVTIVHDQDLQQNVYNLSRQTIFCAHNSFLTYSSVITGAAITKTWLDIVLQGKHAHAKIMGAYALNNKQHLYVNTQQLHEAEDTTSTLMFKGAITDTAYAQYTGTIRIEPHARASNASQNNHTLIMDAQARATSIPSLEVLTDDVQCSHGSAVGQLDAQQLLYMQSRGFDYLSARRLLLAGFFNDLLHNDSQNFVRKLIV